MQVGSKCLLDLSATEEACSDASITAAVDGISSFVALAKEGDAGISPDSLLVRCYCPQLVDCNFWHGPHAVKMIACSTSAYIVSNQSPSAVMVALPLTKTLIKS
jgi:hypothetical protein